MLGKHYFIGVIVITLIGFGLSWLVYPSNNEVAFMNLQDKNYDKAHDMYLEQWHEGNKNLNVSIPLSTLHLQYGNIEQAIKVMEEVITTRPKSIEARKQLGKFYQYGNHTEKYINNLENIAIIEPTIEILRELSGIYNFKGEYAKQIATLKQIIESFEHDATDIKDLIYLYAHDKKFDKAADNIDLLLAKLPSQIDFDSIELAVSIYLEAGEQEKALKLAQSYVQQNPKQYDEILHFADIFRIHSAPQHALYFILPYADINNPEIEEIYLTILSAQSDTTSYREVIRTRIKWESNPARLKNIAEHALNAEMFDDALLAYQKLVDASPLSAQAYLPLAKIWHSKGQYKAAAHFFALYYNNNVGDYESYFLYGESLMSLGDIVKARESFTEVIAQMHNITDLSYDDSIIKAQTFNYLNQHEQAFVIYRNLIKQYAHNLDIITDFTNLLIDHQQFEEAEEIIRNSQQIWQEEHAV